MILEDCIERLQAGETIADCLARYGAQAAELAPLLTTAMQLQGVGPQRLTHGQHLRTKVALREALAERRARAASKSLGWRGWWGQARGLAVAAMLILGIFVTAGVTSVAASRPGDVAYPVRVTLERAPAWLQFSPAGRAAAELQVAERRLADVTGYLQTTGQVAPAAVDALLAGDQAAAANAVALPELEREAITRRVAAHAETLAALARTAGPGAAELTLDEAAAQAAALAERLSPGSGSLPTPPAQPTSPPTPTVAPLGDAPAADITPAAAPQPERSGATPTPLPTPTGRAIVPGQRATALAQTATVTAPTVSLTPAATPTLVAETTTPTPAAGGPVNTPVPGRRATALAATATGQPPTATPSPEPPPTDRPSGATGTPAPGRRATALAQTATAQATPITPTPGSQ